MTLQCEEALQLYQEAATDLETSIASYYDRETPPTWLRRVQEAPCDSWDYPKLVWHHLAWQVRREGEGQEGEGHGGEGRGGEGHGGEGCGGEGHGGE